MRIELEARGSSENDPEWSHEEVAPSSLQRAATDAEVRATCTC